MKRKIYYALMATVASLALSGCTGSNTEESGSSIFEQTGSNNSNDNTQNTTEQNTDNPSSDNQNANTSQALTNDGRTSVCDETTEFDYSQDYTEDITVAVERAVASATSFDDEFKKMDEIREHITSRRGDSENQAEMNVVSFYYFQVWDAELNNLWNRFSETVDEQTKERLAQAYLNGTGTYRYEGVAWNGYE